MQLSSISHGLLLEFAGSVNIIPWSEDADNYDPWMAADQADKIADESGIRIGRDKELSLIALHDSDNVVGAVWLSTYEDGDASVYDFDVAVDPGFRSGRIGLELIDAAINGYYDYQEYNPNSYIRVYVVNPKLIRVLERKYNFTIDSEYSHGAAHMSFHG